MMNRLARFIYQNAHKEAQQQQLRLMKQLYHAQFNKRRFCHKANAMASTPEGIALLALGGVLLFKSKHKISVLRKLVMLRRLIRQT
ncbi:MULTISPECIES: hypothetical protein [unclassified Pseudoalteromonas]|uniref:hypothetical protein n=1 Tax=unclassified Pseudoalteromonas TaxID=194690 RepID=UPI002096BEF7|nr:hypothetical protein [Pseudoalteromonas sp. XMcav2-N]MCO7190674.1 hypothetical protein [Pseudoalteromonas sp. XMcav2-N]